MAIEVGDILRVAFQWFVNGTDEQVNVHHFLVDTLGDSTGDTDFLERMIALIAAEWYSEVVGLIADNVVGALVTSANLTKNEVLATLPNPIDGAYAAAEMLPRQATALVCWNGSTPRRQGRTYLPVFTEGTNTDNGAWESTALAALEAFGAVALDTIFDDDVGVSRVISNADGSSWIFPTAVVIPVAPRTQRRRTLGRGS